MEVKARKTEGNGVQTRSLWTSFFLYAFGVFLVYSAYGTLLSLQSSINIVDGLGTSALATIYVSAAVFALFCVPTLIRKFGPKKCICCCEVAYIIYTLANFHPTLSTMIPASLVVGMGDCVLWSCMPIMNSFYANWYSRPSKSVREAATESKFSGYFFAVFQLAKISGNLVSYSVLYAFNPEPETNNTVTLTGDNISSTSSPVTPTNDFDYCGARDCQESVAVSEAINQYVPENKLAVYILFGIMTLSCIVAVLIHVFFIPNTDEFNSSKRKSEENNNTRESEKSSSCAFLHRDGGEVSLGGNELSQKNSDDAFSKDEHTDDTTIDNRGHVAFALSAVKDVGLQIINLKQLLVTPIILYSGLDFGFITSEVTRSYTSCVFGVAWVPIHMLNYGLGASLTCYLMGKLSKRIPRRFYIAFAALVDGAMYLYCLLWTPNDRTHFSVIPVYFLMGGMQGIWVPVSQVVQVIYFPGKLDVTGPVWNFWFMLGIALQFALSTSLCVSAKIYGQLGVLAIGVIGYGVSEKMQSREAAGDKVIET